ncbi:DUF1883 domain-containing protein [Saccharibacillus brassicae]|uniref:DUF1883 domain-containing protein n=1 Tax=Saccharibacillus brassicae TaxID=2583377 RepID=A0A4Y6UUP2_SACBS|nr:DUF1883 domain-containing protein [Saccharibacillus brassicae]
MNYTSYELGYLSGNEVVEVTLIGTEANVKLLDTGNFNAYRSRRRHSYYGGHYNASPARIRVPHAGHWHVTVDLGGYRGHVRSSVKILS